MTDDGSKEAIVSDSMAKKFASEKETPYTTWVKNEGLDIISSIYVRNLYTLELKPWARREGHGVFLNHDASRTSNDCYVCEIDPGKKLAPQRMLFEEMIMILSGRGSTSVWNDAGERITFEWGPGRAVRHPAQLLAPALQRVGPGTGALRRGHQPAADDEHLRRPGIHLQHAV